MPVLYFKKCDAPINDFIENKCKQMGKCMEKGRAFHLAQWMKGELDKNGSNSQTWSEPEIEIWSEDALKERTEQFDINLNPDNLSAVTEIQLDRSRSPSINLETSPKFHSPNETFPVCQKCHETCLQTSPHSVKRENIEKVDAFLDSQNKWDKLSIPTLLSPTEPFNPVPDISVTPPDTPQTLLWEISNVNFEQKKENIQRENAENNNYQRGDIADDDDDDDSNSENTLPYKSLKNKFSGSLKRYASFSNLNALTDDEDSEKDNNNIDVNANVNTIENEPVMSWANRATNFVVQKMAVFEKIGENIQSSTILESLKYLRPSRDFELVSTSQTLAFEEDCENSGGTSGDEFWGTPNSGGASVASNECAALSPTSSHDDEDGDDDGEQQIIEEMLLNRTTAMLAQQHNMTPSRMLQNKARLETLPEDEEENITKSSSMSTVSSQTASVNSSDCTMSCPYPSQSIEEKTSASNNSYKSHIGQSSNVFSKLDLRRSQSMEDSNDNAEPKPKPRPKIINRTKKSRLMRFFSRDVSDEEEKVENKFWRKLRRRQTN